VSSEPLPRGERVHLRRLEAADQTASPRTRARSRSSRGWGSGGRATRRAT